MSKASLRTILYFSLFFSLSSSTSAASPSFCSILNTTTTLKAGVVSTRVQELQRALNQDPSTQVTTTGAGSPGKETTKYGPATFLAVKRFQEKYKDDILTPNGLTRGTGLFGSSTKKKLYALYCTGIVPPPTPGPTPIPIPIPVPPPTPQPIPQPTPTPTPTPTPINGSCGSSNNQSFTTPPTTNLCTSGTPSPVTTNSSTYSWSCLGSNGGTTASCSATRTVTPAPTGSITLTTTSCSIATGASTCTIPVSWSITNPVSPSVRQGSTQFSTSASGSGVSRSLSYGTNTFTLLDGATTLDTKTATASCVAGTSWDGATCTPTVTPINGSCGSSNNQSFTTPPTTNLCSSGTPSPVTTNSSTYSWSCLGSNGGTTASCSATLKNKEIIYSPRIIISKGGIYTGNWESTDPTIPAVQISTTEPVIIENCNTKSKGHHISALLQDTNVTVRNCTGNGVNPNVLNARIGRFVNLWKPKTVVIEKNTLNHTSGIYIVSAGSSTDKISILFNKSLNLDGRLSDGNGGYLSTYFPAQFIQFNTVQSAKNTEVAWNQIINEPWQSRTEDVISLYDTSGTLESPILLHDNYIQGSYPTNPNTDSFSGGGIIIEGPSATMGTASGYIKIYNNQVVGTSNYGIAIDSGHDSIAYENTVISSGLLSDSSKIKSANVGLILWDYYGGIPKGTFYNNHVATNTVAWMNIAGYRNDWWFPQCNMASSTCKNNIQLPPPTTLDSESSQYPIWINKVNNNGIMIGSSVGN